MDRTMRTRFLPVLSACAWSVGCPPPSDGATASDAATASTGPATTAELDTTGAAATSGSQDPPDPTTAADEVASTGGATTTASSGGDPGTSSDPGTGGTGTSGDPGFPEIDVEDCGRLDLERAQPAVLVDGTAAVPIDIDALDAAILLDAAAGVGSVDAALTFTMGGADGHPVLDLRQEVLALALNGVPL